MRWPEHINSVICGDSLQVMKEIPDDSIDLVIDDPPYGIDIVGNNGKIGGDSLAGCNVYPKIYGDDKPFDPSLILEKFYHVPIFLFGANYYAKLLPEMSSWYIWDKRDGTTSDNHADCELIWSNVGGPARIFRHLWRGCMRASSDDIPRCHPTQKPIALMKWLIHNHSKGGDVVLDPYMGSGSTLVAAKQLGRRYIGIEINPDYVAIAQDRLRQTELFGNTNVSS